MMIESANTEPTVTVNGVDVGAVLGMIEEIDADAPVDELRELCLMSAVYDIVSNSLPVNVVVKKV